MYMVAVTIFKWCILLRCGSMLSPVVMDTRVLVTTANVELFLT